MERVERVEGTLDATMTIGGDACLSDEAMTALAEGSLDPSARDEALAHVHRCESCTAWLAQLVRTESGPSLHEPPTQIGRYPVTGRLGAGGMGSVWLGVDPKLGREVAIKRVIANDERLRARFFREATALASLSHPNVVPIYEVAEDAGVPFLVMERIAGRTLRTWIESRPTSQEVVDVLLQAARGLSAAHTAGIVHRDFKPANVLLGIDGRVRVVDFGLAVGIDHAKTASIESFDLSTSGSEHELSTLTRPGTVLGTPRYMAPEQFTGHVVGPAADQYAWCMVLYEALAGQPAFEGDSPKALLKARYRGLSRSALAKVPVALRPLLERGLEVEPERRWPSMDEVCRMLEASLHRGRRRRAWIVGGLALAAVPIAFTTFVRRDEPCEGARRHLEGVWDEATLDRARAAVLGSETKFAAAAWPYLKETLDGYAEQWVSQHRSACEATAVYGEQSSQVLDLRMACLERARTRFEHVVGLLVDAEPDALRAADDLVRSLPRSERCGDASLLEERPRPDDPDIAEAVADAELILERARVEVAVGRYDAAKERLDGIGPRALSHEPLRAAVLATRGQAELHQGSLDAAQSALADALDVALASDSDDVAFAAAFLLTQIVGLHRVRSDEGHWLFEVADGLAHRAGADPTEAAKIAMLAAKLAHIQGDREEAVAQGKRAVELAIASAGEVSTATARARGALAPALLRVGQPEAALEEARAAVDIHTQLLGAAHPTTLLARTAWATNLAQTGDLAGGRDALEAALAELIAAIGDDSSDVALTRINLAALLDGSGRDEDSLALARAGLSTMERIHGPEHQHTLRARAMVAARLAAAGELEAALREAREVARAVRQQPAWFMSPYEADLLVATVLVRQGELEEAKTVYETMVTELSADGTQPRELGLAQHGVALVLEQQGRGEEAVPHLREALRSFEASVGSQSGLTLGVRSKLAGHLGQHPDSPEDLETAEAELRAVLEQQRALRGIDHPESVESAERLARLLRATGRPDEARAVLEPSP